MLFTISGPKLYPAIYTHYNPFDRIPIQTVFNQRLKGLRNRPFPNAMSDEDSRALLNVAVKQSEHYRQLKGQGLNQEEIMKEFKKPAEMTVFSWRGEIDTTMTPLDSVKYALGFLRSAMMTMETKTGHVKAWVGGPNYKYFMYDMVKLGKRQVGSTVKPFLYTLAMQNGYSPCTMVPNAEQTFYLADGTTWTAKNSGRSSRVRPDSATSYAAGYMESKTLFCRLLFTGRA